MKQTHRRLRFLNGSLDSSLIITTIGKSQLHQSQVINKQSSYKQNVKQQSRYSSQKRGGKHQRFLSEIPNIYLQQANQPKQRAKRLSSTRTSPNESQTFLNKQRLVTIRQKHKRLQSQDGNLNQYKLVRSLVDGFTKYNRVPSTTSQFYQLQKQIGKGAFGEVWLAIHIITGFEVAIKRIEKKVIQDKKARQKVMLEVFLMRQINHPNVIKLLEVFEDFQYLNIVLEYAGGGDLLQKMKQEHRLTEDQARIIFDQTVKGLIACHDNKIAHRDIKLDNILISQQGNTKICDFGVSRQVLDPGFIVEQCGTPAYLAPEIIPNTGYDPFRVDVWSLGVLLYVMLIGNVPFKAGSLGALYQIILKKEINFPNFLSDDVIDLIKKMLTINPLLRIQLKDVPKHRWLKSIQNNIACNDKISRVVIDQMIDLGFNKPQILRSLRQGDLNHITASYFIILLNNAN